MEKLPYCDFGGLSHLKGADSFQEKIKSQIKDLGDSELTEIVNEFRKKNIFVRLFYFTISAYSAVRYEAAEELLDKRNLGSNDSFWKRLQKNLSY